MASFYETFWTNDCYAVVGHSADKPFPRLTYNYLKDRGAKFYAVDASVPLGGAFWDEGASTFVHKDINGRWRDVLTAINVQSYEARALAELGPHCAPWLPIGAQAKVLTGST